ncbi:HD domain-containing protein [Enterococcus faecalis]|nr:HD domain-containing protein [Enterococcus faecalis]
MCIRRKKMKEEFEKIISFIEAIEKLKKIDRTAFTSEGIIETTAEHTWRLLVLVDLYSSYFSHLNKMRIIEIALIHDLSEAITGDISAKKVYNKKEKEFRELEAFIELTDILPSKFSDKYQSLFMEYQEGISEEAKFVKALDKVETIIQHYQGKNPKDFDYTFNLSYGKEYFDNKKLKEIRKIIDKKTLDKIKD